MAYFGENWDDNDFPLAYLITIRTFGTWLHGDKNASVDTHGYNIFRTPKRRPYEKLVRKMRENMSSYAVVFDKSKRIVVQKAIEEVCTHRDYQLKALNVRTNHAHAVVSAQVKPELIANAFKSYATRELRRANLIGNDVSPWSRGRSRRYLWKSNHVAAAVDYVLYCQGKVTFEDWFESKYS